MHQILHWNDCVKEFGCTSNYNSETYEYAHVEFIKRHRGKFSKDPEFTVFMRESKRQLHERTKKIIKRRNETKGLLYEFKKCFNYGQIQNNNMKFLLWKYVQSNPDQTIRSFNKIWCDTSNCWLCISKNHCVKFALLNEQSPHQTSVCCGKIVALLKTESCEVMIVQQFNIIEEEQVI